MRTFVLATIVLVALSRPGAAQDKQTDAELRQQIEKLQKALVQAEMVIQALKTEVQQEKTRAEALAQRAAALVKELQEARRRIAELEAGKEVAPPARDPLATNPPRNFVKGRVTKVEGKGQLVEIDRGSDHGLEKNHTLEVFRLKPAAEYVGVIRLIEVTPQRSVGQLVMPRAGKAKEIQVG